MTTWESDVRYVGVSPPPPIVLVGHRSHRHQQRRMGGGARCMAVGVLKTDPKLAPRSNYYIRQERPAPVTAQL